jgi:hypothetical protein
MEIQDLHEGTDFTEVKKDQEPSKPETNYHADLTDTLSGDIRKEETVQAKPINPDDFTADFTEQTRDIENTNIQADQKKDPVKEDKKATPAAAPKDASKNATVARLFKPEVVLQTFNAFAGRGGAMINKNNPDFLKFDRADQDDIGILLKNTAEEEDWSMFPTKYLLIFLVAIIIVGKIINRNKPKQVEAAGTTNLPNPEQDKIITELQQSVKELREQNAMMQQLLNKKTSGPGNTDFYREAPPVTKIDDDIPEVPGRFFRGYDLDKISWSENGALIDPDKAGTKGYTDDGKKMGVISQEIRELRNAWKLYHELKTESAAA